MMSASCIFNEIRAVFKMPSEERSVQDTALMTGFLALQYITQEVLCRAGYNANHPFLSLKIVFMLQY
jgi:hypothetical protein